MEFLLWLDNSAVGLWVRESPSLWAYPGIITFHTVGLGLLVGISLAVDLLILMSVPKTVLAPMARLFPIMWLGFWVNALSGLLLLVADASIMLRNPVMYIKFGFVILGVMTMRMITHGLFTNLSGTSPLDARAKILATSSMVFWICAIVAGRLTAYIGLPLL